MRRCFSIFLIALFALGPLSATLEASDDSSLPLCCRRNGAHHCAMAMQMAAARSRAQSDSTPSVSAPLTCPYYPGPGTAITTPVPALLAAVSGLPSLLTSVYSFTSSRATPIANPLRARAGRGPPPGKSN